jgi:hypothetical protein
VPAARCRRGQRAQQDPGLLREEQRAAHGRERVRARGGRDVARRADREPAATDDLGIDPCRRARTSITNDSLRSHRGRASSYAVRPAAIAKRRSPGRPPDVSTFACASRSAARPFTG